MSKFPLSTIKDIKLQHKANNGSSATHDFIRSPEVPKAQDETSGTSGPLTKVRIFISEVSYLIYRSCSSDNALIGRGYRMKISPAIFIRFQEFRYRRKTWTITGVARDSWPALLTLFYYPFIYRPIRFFRFYRFIFTLGTRAFIHDIYLNRFLHVDRTWHSDRDSWCVEVEIYISRFWYESCVVSRNEGT